VARSAALLAVLLAGCQEVSFKAGAMPGDFAAARTRCHSEDATAYAACMRELGFFVSTPASGGLLGARDEFEAEYAADPAEDDDYAENVADEGAPPFGSTDAPATGGVPAASAAPRAGPGAATPGAGAQAVPPRHKRAPRTPVAIGSWWKLGGSTGELERVRAECEAREPPGTVLSNGDASVTWTLRKCMRAQGWIGIVRQ
jgi:hypothetical protein